MRTMIRRILFVACLTTSLWGQVTFERLLNTDKEPQNWLTYSGNVKGQRHSLLKQITPANVKNLELQWVWQKSRRIGDWRLVWMAPWALVSLNNGRRMPPRAT
jgi:hypothetical protein